jgi:hypothetical protein
LAKLKLRLKELRKMQEVAAQVVASQSREIQSATKKAEPQPVDFATFKEPRKSRKSGTSTSAVN